MKHLRSSVDDLRAVLGEALAVSHLAEPFVSFDEWAPAAEVAAFMAARSFDQVGVRRDGLVEGRVFLRDIGRGGNSIGDHAETLPEAALFDDRTGFNAVLRSLESLGQIYVATRGHVWGIVTKGDLHKAPFRMWVFALVSLIEMQLLRLIRNTYPNDSWSSLLTQGRINKARSLLRDRAKGNSEIDLADCLQFCDKRDIVLGTPSLSVALGNENLGMLLDALHKLRNPLAHAQDIVSPEWPAIIRLVFDAEDLLLRAEKAHPKTSTAD